MNPRYEAFLKEFGKQPSYKYHHFIAQMKKLYLGCIYESIRDHDEFTAFVENNAHMADI